MDDHPLAYPARNPCSNARSASQAWERAPDVAQYAFASCPAYGVGALPIEAADPLSIHQPALATQEASEPQIAKPWTRMRQITNAAA